MVVVAHSYGCVDTFAEASRLRQYFTRAIASYQHLRTIKMYRTPVGIRTLARVYILLTPILMGPY